MSGPAPVAFRDGGAPGPCSVVKGGQTRPADGRPLRVGLVNNMGDGALIATRRQFRALLGQAAGARPLDILPFHAPLADRTEAVQAWLRSRSRPFEEVEGAGLDLLVVTGAEPRSEDLRADPLWPALSRLAQWAQASATPSLWSCLAAHAAVLRLDGVVRRHLPARLSGLYRCHAAGDGSVGSDAAPRSWLTPHSRRFGLDGDDLVKAGHRIVSYSQAAGVDSFVRDGPAPMVFFQGHPEYEPVSLALEFRRDLRRYLRGEREEPPRCPAGVFDAATAALARDILEAAARTRSPDLMRRWPDTRALTLPPAGWSLPAARLLGRLLGLEAHPPAKGGAPRAAM